VGSTIGQFAMAREGRTRHSTGLGEEERRHPLGGPFVTHGPCRLTGPKSQEGILLNLNMIFGFCQGFENLHKEI
jgi:hypothetical protein